jgi:hypothetical protein
LSADQQEEEEEEGKCVEFVWRQGENAQSWSFTGSQWDRFWKVFSSLTDQEVDTIRHYRIQRVKLDNLRDITLGPTTISALDVQSLLSRVLALHENISQEDSHETAFMPDLLVEGEQDANLDVQESGMEV